MMCLLTGQIRFWQLCGPHCHQEINRPSCFVTFFEHLDRIRQAEARPLGDDYWRLSARVYAGPTLTTSGATLRYDRTCIFAVATALVGLCFGVPARAEIKPVPQVQQTLSGEGFDAGTPDGIWGPKSVAALKAYQRSKGLNPSGVVDQASLRSLFPDVVSPTPDTATPDTAATPPAIVPSGTASPSPDVAAAPVQPAMNSWTNDTGRSEPEKDGSSVAKVFGLIIAVVAIMAFKARPRRKVATGRTRSRRR
ncbi:peptidoglycan-binding domain-containing protein [Rhizobium sp. 21-4511-3d]